MLARKKQQGRWWVAKTKNSTWEPAALPAIMRLSGFNPSRRALALRQAGTSVPMAAATPRRPSPRQMEIPVLGVCQTDNAAACQRCRLFPSVILPSLISAQRCPCWIQADQLQRNSSLQSSPGAVPRSPRSPAQAGGPLRTSSGSGAWRG